MKIYSVPTLVQLLADGARTKFDFPFSIFSNENLQVYVNSQRIHDGFSVEGINNSNGGSIVFAQPPDNGSVITIRRYLPVERLTAFQESSELRASALNKELDYITACIQQVRDDVSRCVSLTTTDEAASLSLPPKRLRAEKLLGFDAEGNIAVRTTAGVTIVNSWRNLDDIPEGTVAQHFTKAERSKLASIQANAAANPPQASAAEKAAGVETQLRSLSPKDIRDIVLAHAPAAKVASVFGRDGAIEPRFGDYNAEQILETAAKVFMTSAERSKLISIEPGAQINPPPVSAAEKTTGSSTGIRSFSPADVKEIAATISASSGGVFFLPKIATANSSHIVTLSAAENQQAVWIRAYGTPGAPVTVRLPASLPSNFTCQLVNDTDFAVSIIPYGVGVALLRPVHTLAIIAGRNERVVITPTPTADTWAIDGELVPA
jgi:hypothetical protein